MTLHSHATTAQPELAGRFRLPDPPEREPDEDMTSFKHLAKAGNAYLLAEHLGNPETTLIEADRWIVPDQHFNKARAERPDMLVAFDVDPAIYDANNGYVVSEQGKPPDFVLKVASESTADTDTALSVWTTRGWACWSTGGSMRRGSSTERGWRANGWRADATNRFRWSNLMTASCRATARRWG